MNIKQQTPQNTIIPAVQNPVLENLRKRFLEEIAKGGGDMADWNFKAPEEWTEDELKEAMLERERSKNQARKKEMMEQERKYFDHRFGGGKVEFDETGKMIQPRPVRGPIRSIMPIKSKEGQTMEEAALDLINRAIPNPSGERYQEPRLQVMPRTKELNETDVVKSLQSGLNLMSGQKNAQSPSAQSMSVKLKEDGVLGPKTASGLKKALVEDGTNKVSEAIGLGQFKETVKKAKKTGGVENLAGELSGSIGRLLPQSKTPKIGFQPEGLALQDTLNDLGANLKDDGIVGPKTTESFNQLVKQKDEDEIVNLFGKNLGFSI